MKEEPYEQGQMEIATEGADGWTDEGSELEGLDGVEPVWPRRRRRSDWGLVLLDTSIVLLGALRSVLVGLLSLLSSLGGSGLLSLNLLDSPARVAPNALPLHLAGSVRVE